MKTQDRKIVVSTRLSADEYKRFLELSIALNTTPSRLLRSYVNSMTCSVSMFGGVNNENN